MTRREAEIEQYFSGYERKPLTKDEISLLKWNEEHFGDAEGQTSSSQRG